MQTRIGSLGWRLPEPSWPEGQPLEHSRWACVSSRAHGGASSELSHGQEAAYEARLLPQGLRLTCEHPSRAREQGLSGELLANEWVGAQSGPAKSQEADSEQPSSPAPSTQELAASEGALSQPTARERTAGPPHLWVLPPCIQPMDANNQSGFQKIPRSTT